MSISFLGRQDIVGPLLPFFLASVWIYFIYRVEGEDPNASSCEDTRVSCMHAYIQIHICHNSALALLMFVIRLAIDIDPPFPSNYVAVLAHLLNGGSNLEPSDLSKYPSSR